MRLDLPVRIGCIIIIDRQDLLLRPAMNDKAGADVGVLRIALGQIAEEGEQGGHVCLLQADAVGIDVLPLLTHARVHAEVAGAVNVLPCHHLDLLLYRLEVDERLEVFQTFVLGAKVIGIDDEAGLIDRGRIADREIDGQQLRHAGIKRLEDVEDLLGHIARELEIRLQDLPAVGRIEHLIGRGEHDAEVLARAPQAPEQIGVLRLRHGNGVPRRGDEPDRLQRVDQQAAMALEHRHPRPERRADDVDARCGAHLELLAGGVQGGNGIVEAGRPAHGEEVLPAVQVDGFEVAQVDVEAVSHLGQRDGGAEAAPRGEEGNADFGGDLDDDLHIGFAGRFDGAQVIGRGARGPALRDGGVIRFVDGRLGGHARREERMDVRCRGRMGEREYGGEAEQQGGDGSDGDADAVGSVHGDKGGRSDLLVQTTWEKRATVQVELTADKKDTWVEPAQISLQQRPRKCKRCRWEKYAGTRHVLIQCNAQETLFSTKESSECYYRVTTPTAQPTPRFVSHRLTTNLLPKAK